MSIEKSLVTFIVAMVSMVIIFMLFLYAIVSLSSVSAKSVEITTKTFITPELEIHNKNGVLDTTYVYTFKSEMK